MRNRHNPQAMHRVVVWEGLGDWRAELAIIDQTADGLSARGVQLGVEPLPYRLDYELRAPESFVTELLDVEATGAGWRRRIELRHDGAGSWSCQAECDGDLDLPPPGGATEPVGGALDCDLGRSPLTNLMPVCRHALHERPGELDFLMAWVSVPDLGLHPSRQRYEHVRGEDPPIVRYVGAHRGFVGELTLDRDGLVVVYPDLARRVAGSPPPPVA